jgi:hypothetical protein
MGRKKCSSFKKVICNKTAYGRDVFNAITQQEKNNKGKVVFVLAMKAHMGSTGIVQIVQPIHNLGTMWSSTANFTS